MNSHWLYLALAIAMEVMATTALKGSEGLTRLLPSTVVVFGYGSSFYLLSVALRVIPLGIAYAVWSGVGLILISGLGVIVYQQTLDVPALLGIGLIIAGVVVINVFSRSVAHG